MTPPNATPEPGIFAASQAAAAGAGFSSFRHVRSTGSTNTDLADEARAGDRAPAVLVTDHQTAGRGRLDRVWIDDSDGQLMVSVRIPTAWADASMIGPAFAVLARAVVAADGVPALIKWPNDLCVRRGDGSFAKLAGYLGEYVGGAEPVVILGMGINVESAPSMARHRFTARADRWGETTSSQHCSAVCRACLLALRRFVASCLRTPQRSVGGSESNASAATSSARRLVSTTPEPSRSSPKARSTR